MDYEEEEYISHKDNKLTISNISNLNQPPTEIELLRAIKFFQLMNFNINEETSSNPEKNKVIKIKEVIQNYLLNSRERLDMLIDFIRITTIEKNIFKLKVLNVTPIKKNEKNEMKKINFLKKLDYFDKSINLIQKKMKEFNENNKISQVIFKELITLKEYGLNVEDNFKFPDKQDTIYINLIHKNLKIYEILNFSHADTEESKQKFHQKFYFYLNYFTKTGNFELSSQFYENFIKKSELTFDLRIKFPNGTYMMNNKKFEIFLDDLILKNLSLNYPRTDKYNLKTILLFFVKYLFYKLFKLEIKNLVKLKQTNFFYHKNFLLTFKEYGKEFYLNLNYFNFLEVSFKVSKENMEDKNLVENESEDSNELSFENKKESDIMDVDGYINDSKTNKKMKNEFEKSFESKYFFLIKTLFENLIYDMRLYKYIKDLSMIDLKLPDALLDYIDNTLFIKNFVKIFQVISRKLFIHSIKNKFENSEKFHIVNSNLINPFSNSYTSRFVVSRSSNMLIKNQHNPKIEFCLFFHKNNVILEFKNQLRNSIYICERETFTEEVYDRIDPQYLINTIENLLEI